MNSPTPEFSRVIFTARMPPKGLQENLQAKPEERRALAARFDLADLSLLTARLSVQRDLQGSVHVSGTLQADLAQNCVVTLEQLPVHMELEIEVTFIPAEEKIEESGETGELDKEIESYSNGRIDLGELVAQQMGVNLDPYPRKRGAALPQSDFGPKAEKPAVFAQLGEILKKPKK